MEADRFDTLARALTTTRSRRSLGRVLSGGVLASTAMHGRVFDAAAISRAKMRCRHKGGVYQSQGTCHCAVRCDSDPSHFTCQANADCACLETAGGNGLCAFSIVPLTGCSTSADCDGGRTCVVQLGCPDSGTACTTSAECEEFQGCINGKCPLTGCAQPCPVL